MPKKRKASSILRSVVKSSAQFFCIVEGLNMNERAVRVGKNNQNIARQRAILLIGGQEGLNMKKFYTRSQETYHVNDNGSDCTKHRLKCRMVPPGQHAKSVAWICRVTVL